MNSLEHGCELCNMFYLTLDSHSQMIIMVADALVPIWHQGICNRHDRVSQWSYQCWGITNVPLVYFSTGLIYFWFYKSTFKSFPQPVMTPVKKESRLRLRYMSVQSTWYMKRLLQSKKSLVSYVKPWTEARNVIWMSLNTQSVFWWLWKNWQNNQMDWDGINFVTPSPGVNPINASEPPWWEWDRFNT